MSRSRPYFTPLKIAFGWSLLTALCASFVYGKQAPILPLHEQVLQELKNQPDRVKHPLPAVHPSRTVFNEEAIIPPQCYTRTLGKFNSCYVCHQDQIKGRENSMNDSGLQEAYSFSDLGMINHWTNLFEDRSKAVANISDAEILQWIAQDNYSDLANRLQTAGFTGWIPDLKNLQLAANAFDEHGFARDGSHWVAFNYKPLPSTFWPTNGSTDDVMIRLPEAFRTDKEGNYSLDVYRANLAIVEANIKSLTEISTLSVDERIIDKDLNNDDKLGIVGEIKAVDRYVGSAESVPIETSLYPKNTEFLHTVRYVGIGNEGEIKLSTRMKEVRYMRKWRAFRKEDYARKYQLEAYEKELGNLPKYHYLGDYGLDNDFGWSIQGFIENVHGDLRPLTFEENKFCMGCHTSIGSTLDKTFSFPRKRDGAAGWGYINLTGMPDVPNLGETKGEILTYLERVGGGGEFRSNPEMFARWFHKDGTVDVEKVRNAKDVYELITPSRQRALELNKAYRVIVGEQDFIYGRDATVIPPHNVYDRIDNENAPTLAEDKIFKWDIRLDWQQAVKTSEPSY